MPGAGTTKDENEVHFHINENANRLASVSVGRGFPQRLADVLLVDADAFIGPADEAVEPAVAVKGVHAFAVEVLFLHLSDDVDGLAAHGREAVDQLIEGEVAYFRV